MTSRIGYLALGLTLVVVIGTCAAPQSAGSDLDTVLKDEFELVGERSTNIRHFELQTKVVTFTEDGLPSETTVYSMILTASPAGAADPFDASYQCKRFTVKTNDDPAFPLASLEGWSYQFTLYPEEPGEARPPLGIPHEPFVNLRDEKGKPLSPGVSYSVYNAFIDFHSICDLFPQATEEGNGIQDLSRLGQTIVHVAAFSEPRIDLGEIIGKGSKFKNGELTLEFRGLTVVDDVPCAIIAFDSGDAAFHMNMKPVPDMDIQVVGRSHFLGEIYLELDTKWVRKAKLDEVVVSKVTADEKILDTSVSERSLLIRQLTEEQFAAR